MRPELRWAVAAAAAFVIGALCAESYARLMLPYYSVVTNLLAEMHPWQVTDLSVVHDEASHGAVLRLTGDVRHQRDDPEPAVRVVIRVQVGEAVEAPIVFWTLLLVWPAATLRHFVTRLLVGIPIFLLLEALTTGSQLVHTMAQASAILAGEHSPVTAWERWSRFLEAGGRFALEVGAGLLALVAAQAAKPRFLRPAAELMSA
jgi:hypothetical protein